MTHALLALLLAVICLGALCLVALGLPGLWAMVMAVLGYGAITHFATVGWGTIITVFALAGLGELIEFWLGYGLTRKYGGSKRAGWGALLGGIVGAGIGVPVPVIGSVIGALVGSFAGAALLEYSATWHTHTALRVGWGAFLGRVAANTAKIAVGLVMAVVVMFAALR
jgi:uncharacterized protein YqgC (DUF456 family)